MGVRAGIKVMKADTTKAIVFRLHQVEWKKSISKNLTPFEMKGAKI
jgi:hypothetical protein